MPTRTMSRASWLGLLCLLSGSGALVAQPVAVDNSAGTEGTAPSWSQFLGENRDGISSETGLLDSWPDEGPKEVWRVAGGVGMSGLSVANGRLFSMIQVEGEQRVICLDATTGKTIWQQAIAKEYRNGQGNGPRATPTIAGDTVLAYTGEGTLAALNVVDGKLRWSVDVVGRARGRPADYGMASSPLLVNDLVMVVAGTPAATLVAFDVTTGAEAWRAGQSETAGYSSPTRLTVDGVSQIVAFTGSAVQGIDAREGIVLWRYPFKTDYDCNIAVPIEVDGGIFISAGESHGSVLLDVNQSAGEWKVTERWQSQGRGSVMRNEWQTSILLEGFLYGFDNVGSAGPVTHLNCVEASTGKRIWQAPRFGKGNLIGADGKLFISTRGGEFVLVKATSKRFEEIGRMKVLGPTRTAPSLCNGLLYLRDDAEIVCLDVRRR